ncbi:MAG: hypothetical protein H0V86_06355, partial [Chloroflexia bacterium]|nr:hypothetical protein [Chloroflexia bacterium]
MPHPQSNREVADTLLLLADLLEIRGEAVFKIAAYRKAAGSISALAEPLTAVRDRKELEQVPGVDKAIAQKGLSRVSGGDRYMWCPSSGHSWRGYSAFAGARLPIC